MLTLNLLILSNLLIGISFLVMPMCCLWLYVHRYKDWPKSWVLLLVSLATGSCGISRIMHAITYYRWPQITMESMTLADFMTAIVSVMAATLLPGAVRQIRQYPTPDQMQRMIKDSLSKKATEAQAKESQRAKDLAEQYAQRMQRRVNLLHAILEQSPIDPDIKTRIENLVRGVD